MRAIIGHPRIGRGGSESVVMWLIEGLKRNFEVTVATTGGWDLDGLNAFYGTRVRESEVKVRLAPIPFPFRSLNVAALRGACYQRFARQIAPEYDVRISGYNITDWGLPAVHFIADFSWHREVRNRLDPPTPGFVYRESPLRSAYLKLSAAHGNPSGRDVLRGDTLIANSKWSANLIKELCGVECNTVVFPPVWSEFPEVSWHEKESAFVMIGRIAPEKRVERAIAILEVVRQRGHAVRLQLCGQIGNDVYGRRIARLCRERSTWVTANGRVSGVRKAQILTHCRFGIQTRDAEPFGISVAEMVSAGAIVFAPNDGGQAEILDCPDLLFSGVEDAANKICAVLSNLEMQNALRDHLSRRTGFFNAENFMKSSATAIGSSLNIESRVQLLTDSLFRGSASKKAF